jgi:hypothetical protein
LGHLRFQKGEYYGASEPGDSRRIVHAFNHTQFDSTNSSGIGSIGSANFGIISATRDPRLFNSRHAIRSDTSYRRRKTRTGEYSAWLEDCDAESVPRPRFAI